VLLGRLIEPIADAEFVEHTSAQAKMVQDLAMVHGLVRHHHLLCK
jgi:hypothetical protein